MKRQHILLPAIVISLLLLQLTFAASPRYEIIDLGTLGDRNSRAYSISDSGQIVGEAYEWQTARSRATLFDPSGSGNNIYLGNLGAGESCALSINSGGQIVGFAQNTVRNKHATLFDPTGQRNNIDLGTLGGYQSRAYCINDSGQIVGWAYNQNSVARATLFDPTGNRKNIDLSTLPRYIRSGAKSINDNGQIVGWEDNHATLFDPTGGGNNTDLGTLGGDSSQAISTNDLGQIVGWALNSSNDSHATLFDPTGNGNNIDLGTLGGEWSWAYSINNSGQIVGEAINNSGGLCATLFDPTGRGNNVDLNTLIDPNCSWTLERAFSINNHGWIVGDGWNPDGIPHAYLLIPKPPTTYYVDDDAAGANTGSSWADAYNYLQEALTAAWSGDEIRVAQGTYKPDQGTGVTPGDRTATFQLINGVTLKGGYAGAGTPDPNVRDIDFYETILTGDLNGDDILDFEDNWPVLSNNNENSYHVVIAIGCDETTVLDGFTITAGNANGQSWPLYHNRGGGMCNYSGSPTVVNCTFNENSATYSAGLSSSYGYVGLAE